MWLAVSAKPFSEIAKCTFFIWFGTATTPEQFLYSWVVFMYIVSGQIIATSHDLTPNGGLVREIPLFQGNLGC